MAPTLFRAVKTGRWAGAMAMVLLAVTAAQVAVAHRVVTAPLVQTVAVGRGPSALAVDQRSNRVFVANFFGNSVNVLDARSGTVLRTISVGKSPSDVAVDARTGRAFVVNAGPYPEKDGTAGTVSVLDSRTGAVVRTVLVGRRPSGLAVDVGSGRVF